MSPTMVFLVVSEGIQRIIGTAELSEVNAWQENNNRTIKVYGPRLFELFPVAGQPGKMNVLLNPLLPIDTKQEDVLVAPSFVHIFGELNSENECPGVGIYNHYVRAIEEWKARLSGILAPTANDISRVSGPYGKH